jgi:hypothetical protein
MNINCSQVPPRAENCLSCCTLPSFDQSVVDRKKCRSGPWFWFDSDFGKGHGPMQFQRRNGQGPSLNDIAVRSSKESFESILEYLVEKCFEMISKVSF